MTQKEKLERLVEFIRGVFLYHEGCEDGWYACPLSADYIAHGPGDTPETRECGCWKAKADELLKELGL